MKPEQDSQMTTNETKEFKLLHQIFSDICWKTENWYNKLGDTQFKTKYLRWVNGNDKDFQPTTTNEFSEDALILLSKMLKE